jgi:tetratricopeptide (TPR) repeat protein
MYWNWAGYLTRTGPLGRNPFFLGPLYPYLLWPIRAVFGEAIQPALVLQAFGGSAAVVLLADATRRLTRPSIGRVVGVIAALYEIAVFFDGLVLMESLLFTLEALLLWLVVVSERSARRLWIVTAIGLVIGLLAEGRATSALLLLPAWFALVFRPDAAQRIRDTLVMIGGFALVVVPFAARNIAVAREWIPFTYNLGFNLYVGNNPQANGGYVLVTGTHVAGRMGGEDGGIEADGRDYLHAEKQLDLSPAASSAWWSREAVDWVAGHPGAAARLTARKALMLWNRREYPQIENAREYREVAGPLGLPLVGSFAVIGPLALAGLFAARGRGAGGRLLIGYALVMTVAILPFFVTDRYRHHLVPAALIAVGIALDEGLAILRRSDHRGWGAWLGALLAGLLVTHVPAPGMSDARYEWGLASDLGTRWAEHGDPARAAHEYERALSLEATGAIGSPRTASDRSERADLYYDYANALGRLGRDAEALTWFRRAVALAPDHAPALHALANAYRRAGAMSAADSLDRALGSKAGGLGLASLDQGLDAARAGQWAEAESLFAQAVAQDPHLFAASEALIRIQIQSNRLDEARSTLENAIGAGMAQPEADLYGALLAAVSGDRTGARALIDRVPQRLLHDDPTSADVAAVVRRLTGP